MMMADVRSIDWVVFACMVAPKRAGTRQGATAARRTKQLVGQPHPAPFSGNMVSASRATDRSPEGTIRFSKASVPKLLAERGDHQGLRARGHRSREGWSADGAEEDRR